MDRQALGAAIRQARERQGLSLRALASRAGVSHAYIGAIELSANHGNVTLAALEAIARGLGGDLVISFGGAAGEVAMDPDHRAMVERAALALASLPAEELEQEARILELRAQRYVKEPAATESYAATAKRK